MQTIFLLAYNIRDLDEAEALRMMVDENSETWGTSATVEQEAVNRLATARLLPWPRGETFAVTLTHDQDQSIRWERRLARHGIQTLRGGGGGRREGVRLTVRDLREGAVSPVILSERIVRWEEEHEIRSTFFNGFSQA